MFHRDAAAFRPSAIIQRNTALSTGEPKDCIEPTIRDLRRIGVLRDDDKILFQDVMHIEYANVIFDLERADGPRHRPWISR